MEGLELDKADSVRDERPGAGLLSAGAVGVVLGLVALLVDQLPRDYTVVTVVAAVATSGLLWGLAALFLGSSVQTLALAAWRGLTVLIAATAVYYGAIVALGTRQEAGVAAQVRAAAIWAAAALLGGPTLGLLGWSLRNASARRSAQAAGVLGGLLAGQGMSYLVADPMLVRIPTSPWSVTVWLLVLLPTVASLWWGHRRGQGGQALLAYLPGALVGAIAWTGVVHLLR